MKVILSRKGMDSKAGGIASPILPDGKLLSLPIPEMGMGRTYAQINYLDKSYEEIIHQISPHYDFTKKGVCHLDPDIFDNIDSGEKPDGWKAAYGQCGASASHLDNMGVGVGDIFLFYGMFKQTEETNDKKWRYVSGAPIQHIIFGYMKVGEILQEKDDIQKKYWWHPHAVDADRTNNRLYLPSEYGTFKYNKKLLLSKEGQPKRSLWELPAFFADNGISISWQGKKHPIRHGNHAELLTAYRGQEFVVVADNPAQEKNLEKWVKEIIALPSRKGR